MEFIILSRILGKFANESFKISGVNMYWTVIFILLIRPYSLIEGIYEALSNKSNELMIRSGSIIKEYLINCWTVFFELTK